MLWGWIHQDVAGTLQLDLHDLNLQAQPLCRFFVSLEFMQTWAPSECLA